MTELRKEISSVFNMTRFLCNSLEHSLEKAFTLEEIHKFKRVVMTGCGDSLCASMAAKECFEELTGRMVDVPTCINLARHYDARCAASTTQETFPEKLTRTTRVSPGSPKRRAS